MSGVEAEIKAEPDGTSESNDSEDLVFKAKEDSLPLVPEGVYQVSYVKYEKSRYQGGYKLYIKFAICDLGAHLGTKVFKPYNYYEPLLRGCDLLKDFELLYGKRVRKNTRLSVSLFKNKILIVRIRTVKKDRKQTELREHQRYSVIDKIIGIAAGGSGS